MATMLLNKTSGKLANPVLWQILGLYPNPESLLSDKSSREKLVLLLQPLGLQNTRARLIRLMTAAFLGNNWRYPIELPGIGKYGDDSYRIFCCGELDVIPTDNKLNFYMSWIKTRDKCSFVT